VYDIRILRIHPGTALYRQMLSSGDVTENWWLEKTSDGSCNHLLPSCLGMTFRHPHFKPIQLQHAALRFMDELNRMERDRVARILHTGAPGHALKFAGTMLSVRRSVAGQARVLLEHVRSTMNLEAFHSHRSALIGPIQRRRLFPPRTSLR
jgi:hypothetical protein